MTPPLDRALFLFDNPNFYKNMKHNGLNKKHLDYMKLANNLALTRQVVDIVLFTSPVDRAGQPDAYANQQRFFTQLQNSGVTLKLGKLEPRTSKCPACNTATPIKVEKSVDVQLALEIVLRCAEYDTLYLISCDADLGPAIKYARTQGKKVFLVMPKGSRCAGVGSVCDATIVLTQAHLDAAQ